MALESGQAAVLGGEGLACTKPAPAIEDVLSYYRPYLASCRNAIFRDLADAPMGAVLSEYFQRGKMLRPLVLFTAAAAVGSDPGAVIPAALALELLHGASLIHDDIIDRSGQRRGGLSLHLLVGVGAAVVLGDYLILRSQSLLAQINSARALEAIQALNRCAEECCRGQAEEMVSAGLDAEDCYFSIVRRKTASPFVAAAAMGGILGGGHPHEIDALRKFSQNVGICFQIRDDELDLAHDPPPSARPSAKYNCLSLPLIYLRKHSSRAAFRKFREMRKSGAIQADLIAFLAAESITERLHTVKQRHLALALEALPNFRNAGDMAAIAYHATDRDA